ncbi:MAG: hypothetical protein AAF763_19250, partial [Pseudomonadota bacterium]
MDGTTPMVMRIGAAAGNRAAIAALVVMAGPAPAEALELPAPGWLAQAMVGVADRVPGDPFRTEGDTDACVAGYWDPGGPGCPGVGPSGAKAEVTLSSGSFGRVEADAAAGTIRAITRTDHYADA